MGRPLPISGFQFGTAMPPGYHEDWRAGTSIGADLFRVLGMGGMHLGQVARQERAREEERQQQERQFAQTLGQRQTEHEDTMAYREADLGLEAERIDASREKAVKPEVWWDPDAKRTFVQPGAAPAPSAMPRSSLGDLRSKYRGTGRKKEGG